MLFDFFSQDQLAKIPLYTSQLKPLIGHHNLSESLSTELWDELLQSKVTWPQLSLLNHGRQAAPVEFTSVDIEGFRDLNISQMLGLYQSGYTIRVRKVNRLHNTLQRLINKGIEQLSPQCGLNLYCSTPASQGLSEHYDRHHIVVLQIKGEKLWSCRPNLEEPPHDRKLNEGDAMFLPSGLYHQTKTIKESMHLTLSFSIPTISEILIDYIKKNQHLGLNQKVPFTLDNTGRITYSQHDLNVILTSLLNSEIKDTE